MSSDLEVFWEQATGQDNRGSWLSGVVKNSNIGGAIGGLLFGIPGAIVGNFLGDSGFNSQAADAPDVAAGYRADFKKRLDASNIDEGTKRELLTLSGTSGDFAAVDKELVMAVSGEGKYAARLKNHQAMTIFSDRPGASQLFATNQSRGNASRGILSVDPSAGLLTPPNQGT